MLYTARFSEQLYPLTFQYPDGRGAGTHDSAWVSLRDYHRARFVILVGDQEAAATIDASVRQATNTAGAGAKAITGKAITQLTGAGNDAVTIELQTEELDVDGGFDCISFRITIAGGAAIYAAWIEADCSRFKPVPTANWSEIIG